VRTGRDRSGRAGARAALLVAALAAAVVPVVSAWGARPSAPRTIEFSGYTWTVKASAGKVGPGPNHFSSSSRNVWVDAEGKLHLRITSSRGRWYCAEVVNTQSLGRGTYTWMLDSPVDALDRNVVLGLFTWNDDPAYNHREIDWEAARWGNAADPTNGQYVVQPWDGDGNLQRILLTPGASPSTQSFTWGVRSVSFASSSASPASWTYAGPDVPPPGGENARMNLWLFRGAAPSDGREVEVVIRSFQFQPLP
jgi:hypothetical protein